MIPLNDITCFLLDMDGTLYLGDRLIDGAADFLNALRRKGKRYIFMTNNSSKNRDVYVKKLKNLGIDASPDEVFTSGEATTVFLNKKMPGAKVYLMGTEALEDEFLGAGFSLARGGEKPDCVVLGFDTGLTYQKLWTACDHIRDGIPYYATHPDINCPTDSKWPMPDAGAMAAFIKASTEKKPIVIGKPNKPIITGVIDKYGLNKKTLAIVGDRLYTDIKTGLNMGITSILVLSGETTNEMRLSSRIKSDYVFDSVRDIIPFM